MTQKPKHRVRHVKHASTTNTAHKSLVKVVVQNDIGEWVRPATGDKFYIDETTKFPSIVFEIKTDIPPPYQWKWIIVWEAHVSGLRESAKRGRNLKTFSEAGSFSSNDKSWQADLGGKSLGGKLSVEVMAGEGKFRRTVFVLGKNPAKADVVAYLATLPNSTGFDQVIDQESHFKNFINADNEPVVAGDAGYGMTQMTHPSPSYEQVWNWQKNVQAGITLFQEKQAAAKKYLGQQGRHYTDEQLTMETITRWNGGAYHSWNPQTNTWERTPEMLCDPATGNIGWDMTKPINTGKTADDLHQRDKGTYGAMKAGQSDDHAWTYSGVCYADHMVNH
ncbi:hypothetical protein EOS_27950 [Caballeronia mineralivorans PML1(12)]|uniref:Uncharacterized protein n=2 Tax=Caballeronia mineralivorans TaxID=2010198 RepID=A0A0J1FT35_9BURK|nr:hypothetical protein EOS_27950 [Caballeronia mineralivorans PML1(12)]